MAEDVRGTWGGAGQGSVPPMSPRALAPEAWPALMLGTLRSEGEDLGEARMSGDVSEIRRPPCLELS